MQFLVELDNIFESFNTPPVKWGWTTEVDNEDASGNMAPDKYIADFKIDDNPYQVIISPAVPVKHIPSHHSYGITFGLVSRGAVKLDMTKTGNQYAVLSTVMDILKNFIERHYKSIGDITFSAEKAEGFEEDEGDAHDPEKFSKSRSSVYNRLIERNLKNLPGDWRVKVKEDEYEHTFILTRR